MTFAWKPEVVERVATLMKQGRSSLQIANVLGVTPNMVLGKVRRTEELHSIGWRYNKENPEQYKTLSQPKGQRVYTATYKRQDEGFAPIPRDTRNRTQVICGDPLWERSALYEYLNRSN